MRTLKKNIRDIVWLCKPYWKYGRGYLILFILVSAIFPPIKDLIYVVFPEKVVDMLAAGRSFGYVAAFSLIVCAVGFAAYMSQCVFFCYFQRKSTYIDLKIKRDIYEKALRLDYKFIDNPEYYNKYSRALNEYVAKTNAARDFINKFLQYFLSVTVLLSVIAVTGPWILVVEAVQLVLHAKINERENKVAIERKTETVPLDRRFSYFHRLFYLKDYSADMKSTLLSKRIFEKYEKTSEEKIDVVNRYARKTIALGIIHEMIFSVTEAVIILYLIYNISVGRIAEVGMYITMMLAYYRIDSKLQSFIHLLRSANELSLNAEKIYEFFDMKSEIEVRRENALVPQDETFSVELKNVSFKYEGSDFALKNMNIAIKPGEKIAVVGENGAGKSTLIKLLLRLYDVSGGEVVIGGKPIKEYDIHALRHKIGAAFQNPNIYAMTLKENVALYNDIEKRDFDKISAVLGLNRIFEKNNAESDIELTKEFEKEGIVLSGGEAQKVALARVMAGSFGLLLLDEPSSALDPIAEYEMNSLILGAANKATTILVAHRLSTTRNADRIVLIDNGEIKECGTHEELMAMRGKYCEMFTKQAENYIT